MGRLFSSPGLTRLGLSGFAPGGSFTFSVGSAMYSYRAGLRLLSVLLFVPLLAACDAGSLDDGGAATARADAESSDAPVVLARPVAAQLAAVRALTAPFHDFEAGEDAGWFVLLSDCVEVPGLGGMGYHFGNPDYLGDGGVVDALEPEALLYEPQRNGRMRLVAVEYVVPVDTGEEEPPFTRPDEDAPVLFGEEFHWNDQLSLWALHVWLWRHNPSGMFADFNPNVSCDFAPVP